MRYRITPTFIELSNAKVAFSLNETLNAEPLVKFGNFLVRKTVAKKLDLINKKLSRINPKYEIVLLEGYRSPEKQKLMFIAEYERLKSIYKNEVELLEAVHKLVAEPSGAGHPTGGAVDVAILESGKQFDFGGEYLDFDSPNTPYFTKRKLSAQQRFNRKLLREVMICEDFIPFNNEWWHFSFGDIEWAYYKSKLGKLPQNEFLYDQVK